VHIECPGDGANGLALENELSSELGLIGQHFLWTSKGHTTRHRRLSPLVGSAQYESLLELGDSSEHGHDHHARRGSSIGPSFIKRL
jgi:hypothetical protein